ncbi:hypothetical protein B0H13DRAFT_1852512 [Mycena leptocephala]|nr:hypothetical protein B0H13DRAFT_1852512 [Mycena leptocephala]
MGLSFYFKCSQVEGWPERSVSRRWVGFAALFEMSDPSSSSGATFDVEFIYEPLLLGVFFNTILFGVWGIFIVETANTAFDISYMYQPLITNYESLCVLLVFFIWCVRTGTGINLIPAVFSFVSLGENNVRRGAKNRWSDRNPPGATIPLHTLAKPLAKFLHHRQVLGIIAKARSSPLSKDIVDILTCYLE